MTEYFYNDTLPAFGETRIIVEKLRLDFIGHPPFVFKPGMPFEGHLSVKFEDQVKNCRLEYLNLEFCNIVLMKKSNSILVLF